MQNYWIWNHNMRGLLLQIIIMGTWISQIHYMDSPFFICEIWKLDQLTSYVLPSFEVYDCILY